MKKEIKQKSVADVIIMKSFELKNKGLTSLEGSSKKVGVFDVSNNKLKNLIGGPKIVKSYYAFNNRLETLEWAPEKVYIFNITNNPTLKNTDGIPKPRTNTRKI